MELQSGYPADQAPLEALKKYQGSTILITGGAGFIGSHLADRLLERGDQVILLDDLSTGRLANIEHLKQNIAAMERPQLPESDKQRIIQLFSHIAEYA